MKELDWSRAKSILIYVYVVVNIFLTIAIGGVYRKDYISKDTIDNTIIALKNRGVLVKCDMSMYNKEIGTLSYNKFEFDKHYIIKNIFGQDLFQDEDIYILGSREIDFVSKNKLVYKDYNYRVNKIQESDIIRYVDWLFLKIGVRFEGKIIENDEANNQIIIYERYKNFYVFGNFVKINLNKDILTIEVNYKKIKKLNNAKKEIMPIHQVLLKNIVDKKGSSIISISLGFRESILGYNIKELDDIPVWRIRFDDGKEVFYKAYTGKEVK